MSRKLPEVQGQYKYDAKLSHLTWFKVGGNAEILYKPANIEDLQYFLQHRDKDIPYHVIGAGSNLLVRDGGVDGVVIKLSRDFADMQLLPNARVYLGGSCLNFNAAHFALEHLLSGLEFLVGIPGCIGGGVWINAGCYGSEFKDIIEEIEILLPDGHRQTLKASEIDFEYRKSNLPVGSIVVGAIMHLQPSEQKDIHLRMKGISEERKSAQPQGVRTGGSTFANPVGEKAWQLIDSVGMRGFAIGGASFSEKHCNFMINNGDATASELEALGEEAKARVKAQYNIDLHWEIKRIGKNT